MCRFMLVDSSLRIRQLSKCTSKLSSAARHLALGPKELESPLVGHSQSRSKCSSKNDEDESGSGMRGGASMQSLRLSNFPRNFHKIVLGRHNACSCPRSTATAAWTRAFSHTRVSLAPFRGRESDHRQHAPQTEQRVQTESAISALQRLMGTMQASSGKSYNKNTWNHRDATDSWRESETKHDLSSSTPVSGNQTPFEEVHIRGSEPLLKQFEQPASEDNNHHQRQPSVGPRLSEPSSNDSSTASEQQEKERTLLEVMRSWEDTFEKLHKRVKPEQVLFVSCLNKNLTERDFLRTLCDGSKGEPFARVVPIRELTSLEKTDNYLVIFHDQQSLVSWRANLIRLSKLSNKYTMRTLSHPEIVPQRDFIVKGEKVDQLVKSYALTPSGTNILTNYDPSKIDDFRNLTAQAGGHGGIVDPKGSRRNGVLLRITGVHNLKLADLLQSIVYDGKLRNMAWTILLSTKNRFSRAIPWDAELQTRKIKNQAAKRAKQELGSQDAEAETHSLPDELLTMSSESASKAERRFASTQAVRFFEGERWIIYFYNGNDAQRFARTWHRKPLPLPPVDDTRYKFSDDVRRVMYRDGGASIKVYAEALW